MKKPRTLPIFAGITVLAWLAVIGISYHNRLEQDKSLEVLKEHTAAIVLSAQAVSIFQLLGANPNLLPKHPNGEAIRIDKEILQDIVSHAPFPPPPNVDFFAPNFFGQEPCIAVKAIGHKIRVFIGTESGDTLTDEVAKRVAMEVGNNLAQPSFLKGLPILTTSGDQISNQEGTLTISRGEFEPACHVQTGHVVAVFDVNLIVIPQPGRPL